MDAALAGQPMEDWAPPPADARPPARLYLPGNECLARAVTTGGEVTGTVPPAAAPPAAGPAGLANPAQAPPVPTNPPPAAPPAGETPPAGEAPPTGTAPAPGTPITAPRVTRLVPIESGTTVPPNVLDPRAPIPSTPLSSLITRC